MKQKKQIETIIIILVILVALGAIYFIYDEIAGKAFISPPINVKLVQTELTICCCRTQQGNFFELHHVITPKYADFTKKTQACINACQVESSTPTHPAYFQQVGSCGGGRVI
ncbi:hypothetical protein COV18_03185 [Candidatus Woesearchaeota archaeon CG10_big_fil_rev_8_21_14_0_10_37_12]|nr:MAG: hypothetical protein COV18_03185 [Candidatus Woesearchaeota archaeon CG10_big_fil_rev_8_21_14_0_10_37_12]